jgi:release factor glutamine methyltransferase
MVHFAGMTGKIVLKTVADVLRDAEKRLRPKKIHCIADVDEGRLDAEVLFAHLLKKDRTWIVAHGNDRISGMLRRRYEQLVARRVAREPVAYIIGKKEFYGRPFHVSKAALVPRPETELFIDILRSRFKKNDRFMLWDAGTGSGAIALTAALEFPSARIIASDISGAALKIAKKNANAYGLARRVVLVKGDLVAPEIVSVLTSKVPLVIAANLPYLPESDKKKLDRDVVAYEPGAALFVPGDGTATIKAFLRQIIDRLPTLPDTILLEFDPPQKKSLTAFAKTQFPTMAIAIHNDLAKRNRILEISGR